MMTIAKVRGVALTAMALIVGTAVLAVPLLLGGNASPTQADDSAQEEKQAKGNDEPLPPGAIARLGTSRWRPGGEIVFLALSPDGKKIASSGLAGVHLWDAEDGQLLERVTDDTRVECVDFSQDGGTLYTARNTGRGTLIHWDISGAKVMERKSLALGEEQYSVQGTAMSSDGQFFVTFCKSKVRYCETKSGNFREIDLEPGTLPRLVAISNDGCKIVVGLADSVQVWDTKSGSKAHAFNVDVTEPISLSLSHAADRVALVGSQKRSAVFMLWDLDTGKKLYEVKKNGWSGCIPCLSISQDGKTLAYPDDQGIVHLVDLKSGKDTQQISAGWVSCLLWSRDSKSLFSAGLCVRAWDVASGRERVPYPGNSCFRALHWSEDGSRLYAVDTDRCVHAWNLKSASTKVLCRTARSSYVNIGRNQDLLAADGGLVASIDVESRRCTVLRTKDGSVQFRTESSADITITPDGKTLAVATPDSIEIWDTALEKRIRSLKRKYVSDGIAGMTISENGKYLAAFLTIVDQEDEVNFNYRTVVRVWHEECPIACLEMTEPSPNLFARFAADGRSIVTVGKRITVWETASGCKRFEVPILPADCNQVSVVPLVTCSAVSPDLRYVALSIHHPRETAIYLNDLKTKTTRTLKGHKGQVYGLAFSPDGTRLASSATDTSILVWDVKAD